MKCFFLPSKKTLFAFFLLKSSTTAVLTFRSVETLTLYTIIPSFKKHCVFTYHFTGPLERTKNQHISIYGKWENIPAKIFRGREPLFSS